MPIAESSNTATRRGVAEPSARVRHARPVGPPWRMVKAHVVALIVLWSYLWVRFLARHASERMVQRQLERAHRRNAQRIYKTMIELQGLYIKVGQLFSIMTNLLPEAFRRELATLQDRVPPHPFSAIETRIRDEFQGRGPNELFAAFDPVPIASASIGQVHVARLHDGRRVAVKVQYPDIERTVHADLTTLRRIFRMVQRFVQYPGLDSIYEEIRALILEELDFTSEARHAQQIAAGFDDSSGVHFPAVIGELSTRRVLTTEFVEGVKVNDMGELSRRGIDRKELARLVIEAYCRQIFHQGVYHADPHPGNILVGSGPTITFVDFGAVGVLSENMRRGIVQLLQAAVHRDTQRITGALHDMGFIAHRADPRVYDQVIDYLHHRFQREIELESFNLKDIRFDPQKGLRNLADLRQMDISLGDITNTFHVPKEWIVLERTLLLLLGLCTELDPELNPMTVITPHLEQFVLGNDGDWSRFMVDTGRDVLLALIGLPSEMRKFTSRVLQGDLQIRVTTPPESLALYHALVQQLMYTALGIASAVFGVHFYERGWDHTAAGLGLGTALCALQLLRASSAARKQLQRRHGR